MQKSKSHLLGTLLTVSTSSRSPVSAQICPRCASFSARNTRQTKGPLHMRQFSASTRRRQPDGSIKTSSKESLIPQTFYEYFSQTLGADAIPPKGSFGIDVKALKREFLQLQQKAHPDLAPAGKKRQAEGLSARINEAYKTLQNPLLRAQYLLKLRGIDVAEDETAKVDDPELLMEVLETRETIEEAQDESDLLPLTKVNDKRIASSVEILDQAFKADDMETAKSESVKLRYWVNIKDSIDVWEKGKPVVLIH